MEQSGDGQRRIVREYDWGTVSPSYSVIDAIARFEGAETPRMTDQLDPRLAEILDTDALNSLTRTEGVSLEFDYANYHVQLEDGKVTITDQHTLHHHPKHR